jgi:hypothetical protein
VLREAQLRFYDTLNTMTSNAGELMRKPGSADFLARYLTVRDDAFPNLQISQAVSLRDLFNQGTPLRNIDRTDTPVYDLVHSAEEAEWTVVFTKHFDACYNPHS